MTMDTLGIGNAGPSLPGYPASKRPVKSSKSEGEKPAASAPKGDQVTLSEDLHEKRMDAARERIKKGFYESDEVRDRLTDKLSGLFDNLA